MNWTYSYDAYNDASYNWNYEIYRMGYAFDDDYLYFNMLTGVPENGRGKIQAGDLYINVGGSLLDGYVGSGYNAAYASGKVFGPCDVSILPVASMIPSSRPMVVAPLEKYPIPWLLPKSIILFTLLQLPLTKISLIR